MEVNCPSASRTGSFFLEERAPDTNGMGQWVDQRAGLDASEIRKKVLEYGRNSKSVAQHEA
jgi:hypothetical protein